MTSESSVADDYGTFVARLDPALAIVTLCHDGDRSGCLVGFHSSCSIDPPLHAVWLSQANHTYALALESDLLAVHLVDAGAHDLAEHFGGLTGDETDKFAGIAWHPGLDDVPLLDDLGNRVVGRRVRVLDAGGDHTCMVLEGEFQRSVHGPGMIAGAVDHHRPLETPGCQVRRCRCASETTLLRC